MAPTKINPFFAQTLDSIFDGQDEPWQLQLKADLETNKRVCGIESWDPSGWVVSFKVTRFDGELFRFSEEVGVTIYRAAMGPSFYAYESVSKPDFNEDLLPRKRFTGPLGVFARVGTADCVFTDLADCLKQVDEAVAALHQRLEVAS